MAETAIGPWRAWRVGRGWGLVLPVVACLPVARAVVRVVRAGWVPMADEGIIALRAHDVLTMRTPALGQMSLASGSAGAPTRSPGPLGYWVLAPAAQVGPLWLVAAAAGVVAVVAVVATVHLAGRRGGLALAVGVTAGLVLSARAVDPDNHAMGWNPSIALAPMALLVLLAWSVGIGERRKLPATVLVASFVAQAHVAYLLPAVAAVAVAVAGGWGPDLVRWWRTRRRRDPDREPVDPGWRPLVAAGVVAAVVWAAPLLQQAVRRPGNLVLLARSTSGETQGWAYAGRVLAGRIGAPPAFARPKASGFAVLAQIDPRGLSLPTLSAVALVIGLVALVVHGVRHGRRDVAVPPLLVLALLAAAAATLRATPTDARGISVVYTSWWLIPVGMLTWAILVATALRASPRLAAAAARVATARPGVVPVLVGVVVVATAATALGTPIRDPEAHLYPVARAVGDAVVAEVRVGRRYEVAAVGTLGFQLASGIAYRVRRAGGHPVMRGSDGLSAGREYVPTGVRCEAVVSLVTPDRGRLEPPPGARVLLEVAIPPGPAVDDDRALVAIGPDTGPPSC